MRRTSYILSARDIEEYFFCPMVFYISVVLKHGRIEGHWADLGKEIQKDVEPIISSKFKILEREFRVESERLGVRGKVDYVVEDGKYIAPLEVKYSRSFKPWWKYTAVLYGILLEDFTACPVKRCYLFLTESKRLIKIDIGDADRSFVEHAIKRCYEILNGKIPKPSKSRSCRNCDFKHLCAEFS